MQNKLYVGNLNYKTAEDDLRELFTSFGEVTDVRIPMCPERHQSRGFGFVTFADADHATKAQQEKDGSEFMGRTLKVNKAIDRQDRGGRGGRTRSDRTNQESHFAD